MTFFMKESGRTTPQPKLLKRIEVEERFNKNQRAVEAKKAMENKDVIKKGTNFHGNMMRAAQKGEEIDPHLLNAYGVQYNPDRDQQVYISAPKQEELDNEFVKYIENRQNTPSSERARRKKDEESSIDTDDSVAQRKKYLQLKA